MRMSLLRLEGLNPTSVAPRRIKKKPSIRIERIMSQRYTPSTVPFVSKPSSFRVSNLELCLREVSQAEYAPRLNVCSIRVFVSPSTPSGHWLSGEFVPN